MSRVAAAEWVSRIPETLIFVASLPVFFLLDILDVIMCLVFNLLDQFLEGKTSSCYCMPRDTTQLQDSFAADNGESELSESLHGRKNIFRRMSNLLKLPRVPTQNGKFCVKKRNRWSDCGCESCLSWMNDDTTDPTLHLVVKEQERGVNNQMRENVIFLHGFLSSSSLWKETVFLNLSEHSRQNYRLFAVDLLGFGRSPKPEDCLYTLRDHVDMIKKSVIGPFGLKSFHLVAHSMGCVIALALAAQYSVSVKSITLIAPMVKDEAAEQDLHFMTEGEVGVSIEVMTAAGGGGGVANPTGFAEDQQAVEGTQQGNVMNCDDDNDGLRFLQGNSELAMIFLEWLKQNKDYICAEDMRSIKLKRSTIESASKRLGSSKEGKKQLLKLILEWVEQYQLQKVARLREGGAAQSPNYSFDETVQIQDPNQNPNFIYNPDPTSTFPPTQCFAPAMHGYSADPYSNSMPMNDGVVNGIPYQQSAEYPVMEHAPSWAMSPYAMPPSQFSPYPDNGGGIVNRQQSMYGNPYQMYDPNGERIMKLGSSATKEARKKRMARLYSHHHRHCSNSNQHQNQLNDSQLVADGVDDGDPPGDWMYWSPNGGASCLSPTATNVPPADAVQPNSGDRATMQQQNSQRQASTDRRQQQQGWKTEKNLKFLLQKVLKQSDVGNLGRIVLPKKEAESHLPELETGDGISIAMEDMGTSRVWNMRYRFWPNNKSRMYLLENTGDFVRVNGLQEGDFIVIYSDTKCGKYMIRGVKVRQPGGKLEGKKPVRRNIRNVSSLAGNSSSPTPIRQAVR